MSAIPYVEFKEKYQANWLAYETKPPKDLGEVFKLFTPTPDTNIAHSFELKANELEPLFNDPKIKSLAFHVGVDTNKSLQGLAKFCPFVEPITTTMKGGKEQWTPLASRNVYPMRHVLNSGLNDIYKKDLAGLSTEKILEPIPDYVAARIFEPWRERSQDELGALFFGKENNNQRNPSKLYRHAILGLTTKSGLIDYQKIKNHLMVRSQISNNAVLQFYCGQEVSFRRRPIAFSAILGGSPEAGDPTTYEYFQFTSPCPWNCDLPD